MSDVIVTDWKIKVGQNDATEKFNPFLESINVSDKDGTASDTADIVLNDTRGLIRWPQQGAIVTIEFYGVTCFSGTADEIRSSGTRSGGSRLTISCKGFDGRGKIKQPLHFHQDGGTFKSFIENAAARSGFKAPMIDPVIGDIERGYWLAQGESLLAICERYAREFGSTFKVRNDQIVMSERNSGRTASGLVLGSVVAELGVNLLSWDVAPYVGRPRHKKTKSRWFNQETGKYETVTTEIEGDASDPEAVTVSSQIVADAGAAGSKNKGRKKKTEREGGEGSVSIAPIDPGARAEGICQVKNVRPGIDGEYRISGVTHRFERGSGGTTNLELKQPGTGKSGGLSKDDRQPSRDWGYDDVD